MKHHVLYIVLHVTCSGLAVEYHVLHIATKCCDVYDISYVACRIRYPMLQNSNATRPAVYIVYYMLHTVKEI